MSTKITTALGLLAGFIGGAMSHYLFVPMAVRAQAPAQTAEEIRAHKFVLVDENGTVRGVFGFRSDGTPDLQVNFGKKKGLSKLFSIEIGSVRWSGGMGDKFILPDLRPAQAPMPDPPSGSE